MAGMKLEQFKGVAPKVAPELLSEGLAQIARNTKLDSGNIIPYTEPRLAGSTGRTGPTQTIYPLRDPDTDELIWLSWADEVDVATPAFEPVVAEQRIYYTGDGVPKVTTYALATSGAAPYPTEFYELGLPLPETTPVGTATVFDAKDLLTMARDSSGLVTFTTDVPHELKTGMVAAIKGFSTVQAAYSRTGTTVTVNFNDHGFVTGNTLFITVISGDATSGSYPIQVTNLAQFTFTDPNSGTTAGGLKIDLRSYNTTGSKVTVVDDTTFTMFLPGFEQAESTLAGTLGASVELAGETSTRTYVYTWYTPWGEESVASDPTEDLLVKEGQLVTISGLPSSPPIVPERNFIRGIRLYRTLAGQRESNFFLLRTLWFPQNTATVARAGTTVTVTMQEPHNFLVDDRFKLTGCTNASIDITDGIVTDTADAYTFSYESAGTAIAETADTTGVLYHDVSENPDTDDARYWGDSTFDFTDDFNSLKLTDILVSDEWIAPPEDMQGLTVIQNNILAGFVRNSLYLSEPDQAHAWPEAYIRVIDTNIVAIRPLSGIGAVILTEKQPYILTGADPANMTLQKVDALYPCVSARGAVSMSFGVLFPTFEGLALYSPSGGARLATAAVYNSDTWTADYDPTTFVGVYYDNDYFASHSNGSIVYIYDPQSGGSFVNCDTAFTAAYNDAVNGIIYLAIGENGEIFQWDDSTQPTQTAEWKSKIFIAQDYTNLGAARVLADYDSISEIIDEIDELCEECDELLSAPLGLTFTLWANENEVFSNEVFDEEIFRLPRGYRSDTFEVAVEGDIRVKSIHLGQSPLSLKEV